MHLDNKIVEQSLQNNFSRQFVSANFRAKSLEIEKWKPKWFWNGFDIY